MEMLATGMAPDFGLDVRAFCHIVSLPACMGTFQKYADTHVYSDSGPSGNALRKVNPLPPLIPPMGKLSKKKLLEIRRRKKARDWMHAHPDIPGATEWMLKGELKKLLADHTANKASIKKKKRSKGEENQ
jgi:hypothetical protein